MQGEEIQDSSIKSISKSTKRKAAVISRNSIQVVSQIDESEKGGGGGTCTPKKNFFIYPKEVG